MLKDYSWFKPISCYQKMAEKQRFYVQSYCNGNTQILIASLIVSSFLLTLVLFQLKKVKSWTSLETWLPVTALIYELTVVARYTFTFTPNWLYTALILSETVMMSYIMLGVCYLFVE